jgi:hypothetical protein
MNETSCWATGRGGPFPLPPDCSNIVRGIVDGCLLSVERLRHYAMMGDASSQLQFTVVDVTLRFVKGNKPLLNEIGKWSSP